MKKAWPKTDTRSTFLGLTVFQLHFTPVLFALP